jgi:ADP-heptose:LPS heptosyltransferase
MKKVLIIRFSSIGDIILCTPVLRSIKKNYPEAEVYFLTKQVYSSVLDNNPYINKVLKWEDSKDRQLLNQQKFDALVDLHRNLRTLRVRLNHWMTPYFGYAKQNLSKWLLVRTKNPKFAVDPIVDRYHRLIDAMNVQWDGDELDYSNVNEIKIVSSLPDQCIVLVLGGTYYTKRIPEDWIHQFLKAMHQQESVVLLGGPSEKEMGDRLQAMHSQVINKAGSFSLAESAAAMKTSRLVITGDTGLAHMAAAIGKPIIWLWGNTVPGFGMMSPTKANIPIISKEVEGLNCRPCSKLGFDQCPKGHFKCMSHVIDEVISDLEKLS